MLRKHANMNKHEYETKLAIIKLNLKLLSKFIFVKNAKNERQSNIP